MNIMRSRKHWALASAVILAGCAAPQEEASPKPVVAVKVAQAQLAEVRTLVSAPAVIHPREQANIAARVTAPIRTLKVKKGDSVKAGQVLAILENRDTVAQEAEATAAVDDAQASLLKTSTGTLPTDVEHARGQVATTEAALNLAQKIYQRRAELFKQGAIPQRDVLTSETELAQAKTNYEVAKKSLDLLLNQSGERDIRMAESRLAQAKARRSFAEAQVQFTELRSPTAGTITEQFLYPGDMAKPEVPVFTVMDLSVAVARAQVPETDVGQVRTGQACEFVPADSGPAAAGRISLVNRAVDPARRTVEVWCEIPNTGANLRAGVFGQTRIFTGKASGVVIPKAAVQFVEGTHSGQVMLVKNKTAHKQDVETGQVNGESVQVIKGLSAGETVITEGGYGLPDGTEVTIGAPAK